MLLLGTKYSITDEEKKLLLTKVAKIHTIDIKRSYDDEVIEQIRSHIKNNKVEFLVLNLDKKLSMHMKGFLEEVEHSGIKILIFIEFAKKFLNREFIEFNANNIETYKCIHNSHSNSIIKSAFDYVFAICALVAMSPIMLLVALAIKIVSPSGSVFFTQQRLGLNGKFFRVWKFRTMVIDAEDRLQKMLDADENIKKQYLTFRKLSNDPRIIPIIGRFLRKTSIDELPQFFNVLLGEMSIVGPRPYIENELHNHDSKFLDIILSVKPGITGLWQVSSRNDTVFNNRVMQDVEYVATQSFVNDLKIIFKTIFVVLKRRGV